MKEKRFSRQREAILLNLKSRNDHPTAQEVYLSVRETFPNVSLGTVYRNLNELAHSGVILSFEKDLKEHFDANTHPHLHFNCTKCGLISDLHLNENWNLNDALKISCEHQINVVLLTGVCKNCLTNNNFNKGEN